MVAAGGGGFTAAGHWGIFQPMSSGEAHSWCQGTEGGLTQGVVVAGERGFTVVGHGESFQPVLSRGSWCRDEEGSQSVAGGEGARRQLHTTRGGLKVEDGRSGIVLPLKKKNGTIQFEGNRPVHPVRQSDHRFNQFDPGSTAFWAN